MQNFIEWAAPAAVGGLLIGISAAGVLLLLGRVAGISGILGGLLSLHVDGFRSGFFLGLLLGGLALSVGMPQVFAEPAGRSLPMLVAAGLLVGVGTRLGSGCTSGHGVCGIGRMSKRSIMATITFMATGFVTASVLGSFGGPG